MRSNVLVRFLACCIMILLGSVAVAQSRVEREYDDDGDYLVEWDYHNDDTTKLARTKHYVYARGGALAAIVYYRYSRETGQVESHGYQQVRHDHIVSDVEYSADELLLMKARYRFDRFGRSRGYKVTHYNDDETTNTTKVVRRYIKDHCYEKTYVDGRFWYDNDYEYPRQNATKLKHSR